MASLISTSHFINLQRQILSKYFVGRKDELNKLSSLFDEFLLGGEEPIVVITGESGVGKTWLASKLIDMRVIPSNILLICVDAKSFNSVSSILMWIGDILRQKYKIQITRFDVILSRLNAFLSNMYSLSSFIENSQNFSEIVDELLSLVVPADFADKVLSVLDKYDFDSMRRDIRNAPVIMDMLLAIALAVDINTALNLLGTRLFLFIDSFDNIAKDNPSMELLFSLLNSSMILICSREPPQWKNEELLQKTVILRLEKFNRNEIEELAKKYNVTANIDFISKISKNVPANVAFIMKHYNEIPKEEIESLSTMDAFVKKIVERTTIEIQKILNMLSASVWMTEDLLLLSHVNPEFIKSILSEPFVAVRVDTSVPIILHDLFNDILKKYVHSVFDFNVLNTLRELSAERNVLIICEYLRQAFRFSPATVVSDFEKIIDNIIAERKFIENKEILFHIPLLPHNFFSIRDWINTVLKVARLHEFLLMLDSATKILEETSNSFEFSNAPQDLKIRVIRRLARVLAKQNKLNDAKELLQSVINSVPLSTDALKELIRAKELYILINLLMGNDKEIEKTTKSMLEHVSTILRKFESEKEKVIDLLGSLGKTLVRISRELAKREKMSIAYELLKETRRFFDSLEVRDVGFLYIIGDIYKSLGEVLLSLGKIKDCLDSFKEAIKYYEKYLSVFPDDENVILELIKACFNLGETYFRLMLYSKALDTLRKTQEILQKYKDKIRDETFATKILADVSRINGEILLKMMELDKALQELKRSIELYKKLLKEREDVSIINNMASALREMSHIYARKFDYENAIKCLNMALDLLQKSRSREYEDSLTNEIATIFRTFAEINMKMANYNEALKHIEKAEKVYEEKLKKHPKDIYALGGLADSYRLMSQIYLRMGRFDLALQYLMKAIEKYREKLKIKSDIYAQVGLATSLRRLGNMYLKLKQFEEALKAFNESIKLYEKIIEKIGNEDVYVLDGIATAYRGLADVYVQLNDFKNAYKTLLKSVEIFKRALEKIKDKEDICIKSGYADALRHLGSVLGDMEKFDEALKIYMEAIEVYEDLIKKGIPDAHILTGYATTLKHVGGIYLKQRIFSQAIEYFKRSIAIYERLLEKLKNDVFLLDSYASALRGLGEAYTKRMQYEEALAIFKRTKEIYETVSKTRPNDIYVLTGLATTYRSLGYIYSRLGYLSDAIEMFKNALNLHMKLLEIIGFRDIGTLKSFVNVLWRIQSNKKIALSLKDQILHGIDILMKGIKELIKQNNISAIELLCDLYLIKSDVLWDHGNWSEAIKLLQEASEYIEKNKDLLRDNPELYLKLKYKILLKRARLAYDEKDIETTLSYLEECEKLIDKLEKLGTIDKQTIDLLRNEVDLIRLKAALYGKYKNLFLLCLERILERIRSIKDNPVALGKHRRIIFGLIRTLEYLFKRRLERFLERNAEKAKNALEELKELLQIIT